MSRLATIWRTRPGSASAGGSAGRRRRRAAGASRRSAGPSARPPRVRPRPTSIGRRLISTWSASIRATSSRSLTRSTSRSVERRMMSTNSRWRSVMALGRAREQLDEALDRGERTAQLVRGGGHEVALGPLEPGAFGHVAHRPHDAVGAGAERRGHDAERAPAVLDDRLAWPAPSASGGSGLVESVRPPARARARARSRGGSSAADRRGVGLGDDQPVAEALDRDRESPAARPRVAAAPAPAPRPSR